MQAANMQHIHSISIRTGARRILPHAKAVRDATANIVESVASVALRTRLRKYEDVTFKVDCYMQGLLSGFVDGVELIGKGWESPQGLKARLFYIAVGRVAVDASAILFERRIKLAQPPFGVARVVFTAQDFGAFLVHPLMVKAASTAVQGNPFKFDPNTVTTRTPQVQSNGNAPEARVYFTGSTGGRTYHACLHSVPSSMQAGSRPATSGYMPPAASSTTVVSTQSKVRSDVYVTVKAIDSIQSLQGVLNEDMDAWHDEDHPPGTREEVEVATNMTRFFRELLIDLQGVELSFRALHVLPPGNADVRPATVQGVPVIDLGLNVCVRDFPPLNMQF